MILFNSKIKISNAIYIFLFLLILTTILGINNYIYLSNCKDIFIGDQVSHLTGSILNFGQTKNLLLSRQAPGLFLVTHILFTFLPINEITAISTNLIFAFFLFLATFMITWRITNKKSYSFFSVILIFLYPITFGLSRFYLKELSLMSAVTMFIFFILYSNEFENTLFSILAALSIGIGTLTKESFPIFIFFPIIYQIYISTKKNFTHKKKINMFLFLLIGILSCPWFLSHPLEITKDGLSRIILGANNSNLNFFSIKNIFFYLYTLIDFSISWILFFIFSLALIPFFRKYIVHKNILIIWIVIPYVIFLFFPWKLARYIAPIVPAIAIITALGISMMKKKYRYILCSLSITLGTIQFISLSYDIPLLKEKHFIRTKIASKLFSLEDTACHEDFWICRPNKQNTNGLEILQTINKYTQYLKLMNDEQISICRMLNAETFISGGYYVKQNLWIEHSMSSSIQFYNSSKNFNYAIHNFYIDGETMAKAENEGFEAKPIDQYDIILTYVPQLLKNIKHSHVYVDEIYRETNNDTAYIFLNKLHINNFK